MKRKKQVADVTRRRLEMQVKDLKEEKKKVEEENVSLKNEVIFLRRDNDDLQERLEKEKEEKQKLRQVSGLLSAANRLLGE